MKQWYFASSTVDSPTKLPGPNHWQNELFASKSPQLLARETLHWSNSVSSLSPMSSGTVRYACLRSEFDPAKLEGTRWVRALVPRQIKKLGGSFKYFSAFRPGCHWWSYLRADFWLWRGHGHESWRCSPRWRLGAGGYQPGPNVEGTWADPQCIPCLLRAVFQQRGISWWRGRLRAEPPEDVVVRYNERHVVSKIS